jgi:hypothetical protein
MAEDGSVNLPWGTLLKEKLMAKKWKGRGPAPTKLHPYYAEEAPQYEKGAWFVKGPTQATSLVFLEKGADSRAFNYADGMNYANEVAMKKSASRIQSLRRKLKKMKERAANLEYKMRLISAHQIREDRRHRGMVDISEVETLQLLARSGIKGSDYPGMPG